MKHEGGYDDGYKRCRCFWGEKPGSLILQLERLIRFDGLLVLDMGCGEGKNAFYMGNLGARVLATDCSASAIRNAHSSFAHPNVTYSTGDVRYIALEENKFDVTVAYGLLHCLHDTQEVLSVIEKLRAATRPGGYMIVCAFNDRDQDLSAHPGFSPFLAPHSFYIHAFSDWENLLCSDEDLYETHPHNSIPHHHSMTRIICRRPQ